MSGLVPKVCKVIWKVLQPRVFPVLTREHFLAVAEEFSRRWNFPNCVGAIDGKHIHLDAPPNSGSLYFNYKQGFSVNLMASCDAGYKLTSVYIGCYGRESDGGVFAKSNLGTLVDNADNFPTPADLPFGGPELPYVFVADDAFPLKPNLMKPYPGMHAAGTPKRVYNYRLSRARRCIENTFGIMCARWRVLRNRMSLLPDNAIAVVSACCCLHNYLMQEGRHAGSYCPWNFADTIDSSGRMVAGDWRNTVEGLPQVARQGSNMHSRRAADVRDSYASFFHGPGAVPWQWK